jgi:hypothetical protein
MNNQFDELTKSLAQSVTRRAALKTLGLGLAGAAMARFGLHQAHAITNGELDGEAHPNVGGFVWLISPNPSLPSPLVGGGSGSLIHPRVILTAGHGTYLLENLIAAGAMTLADIRVSFASDSSNPDTWREISAFVTHPAYVPDRGGGGNSASADIGVTILAERLTHVLPVPLPPPGLLDALNSARRLKSGSDRARFTTVGYGVELGPNPGHPLLIRDGRRRVAESEFRNLHPQWLFLDQNVVHDLGGTGSGDSGGPTFWVDPLTGEETLVAIGSRGTEARSIRSRVDTEEALNFLHHVIALVEAEEL